jgi:hypothetical protein
MQRKALQRGGAASGWWMRAVASQRHRRPQLRRRRCATATAAPSTQRQQRASQRGTWQAEKDARRVRVRDASLTAATSKYTRVLSRARTPVAREVAKSAAAA